MPARPTGPHLAKPATRAAAAAAKQAGAAAPATPTVHQYLAAYVMGVANRLANGASNHYRRHFNLGMSEWRAMMAIGGGEQGGGESIVRQVAEMADLDHAAASKSVRVLEERGLVTVEQTSRRGRAAIVRFTPEGTALYRELRKAALRRQRRLVSAFSEDELAQLWSLLRRLEAQVPHMNAE